MLRQDQYALITVDGNDVIKRYPTNSMQSTIDSYMDFRTDNELTPEERETAGYFLKKASLLYGLDLPFEKQAGCFVKNDGPKSNIVKKKEAQKSASPQYTVFALEGRYPIDTPALVKQACAYFDENWRQFSFMDRRSYAQNVQKQAAALGYPSSRMIEKFASVNYSANLRHELNKRASLSNDPAFDKLGNYIGKVSVDEFASILGELDKKAGITSSYNKSILDPQAATLQDPIEKIAAIGGKTWEIDGISYSEEEMKKGLAHPDVISLYGSSLVSQLRNPEVFDELSIPDKKVILQYGSVR